MAGRNMSEYDYRNPQVLYELYHHRGLSLAQIGAIFDKNFATIHYWMQKYQIERRNQSEAQLEEVNEEELEYGYRNEQVLHFLYHEQELSLVEIGNIFNKSPAFIRNCMIKSNVPTRPRSEYIEQVKEHRESSYEEEHQREEWFEQRGIEI